MAFYDDKYTLSSGVTTEQLVQHIRKDTRIRISHEWPNDPFVQHTQNYRAYTKLKRAAQHDPKAAEYLRSAPGPKFMRRMTVAKVAATLLLATTGI